MAWTKIEPTVARVVKRQAAVTVRVSPPTKRGISARLFISIRPELMEGGLPFWVVDNSVSVMAGTDDDEGRLRIEPGRDYKIGSRGVAGRNAASIIVPLVDWIKAGARDRMACPFDHNEGWLEIDIPEELRRQSVAAPSAAAAKGTVPFRTAATQATAPRPAAGGR